MGALRKHPCLRQSWQALPPTKSPCDRLAGVHDSWQAPWRNLVEGRCSTGKVAHPTSIVGDGSPRRRAWHTCRSTSLDDTHTTGGVIHEPEPPIGRRLGGWEALPGL